MEVTWILPLKLLQSAETEADGGRDLVHAAELTLDSVLRRLFLFLASDEQRYAALLRQRGTTLICSLRARSLSEYRADSPAPGDRGLDDLRAKTIRNSRAPR